MESSGTSRRAAAAARVQRRRNCAGLLRAETAGRLFVIALLPCALDSISRLALEWLVLSYPSPSSRPRCCPKTSVPPTWLTAITAALWSAMAWAFILRSMADQDAHRGIVTARILRPARLRFELSGTILFAAAVLRPTILLDGMSRLADRELLSRGSIGRDTRCRTTP